MSRLFSWDIGSDIGAPDPELHSSECVRSCGVCMCMLLDKRALTEWCSHRRAKILISPS